LVLLMLWSDHHSGDSNAEAIYFEIGMIVDLYDNTDTLKPVVLVRSH